MRPIYKIILFLSFLCIIGFSILAFWFPEKKEINGSVDSEMGDEFIFPKELFTYLSDYIITVSLSGLSNDNFFFCFCDSEGECFDDSFYKSRDGDINLKLQKTFTANWRIKFGPDGESNIQFSYLFIVQKIDIKRQNYGIVGLFISCVLFLLVFFTCSVDFKEMNPIDKKYIKEKYKSHKRQTLGDVMKESKSYDHIIQRRKSMRI